MRRGLPKFLIPILLLIGVCVIGVMALGGLGRGLGGLLGGGSRNIPQTGNQAANLGRAFVASQVDRNGCPLDAPQTFDAQERIYAGLEESEIPAGTSVFARLYYEGQALEDTNRVTAQDDLRSCVWFEFDPGSQGFESGDYLVEIIVDGQSGGRVPFTVSGNAAAQAQIGRLYTSTNVDQGGCPVDDVSQFYSDEAVYVATDRSSIPRGTEIFARLVYEGTPVEDADIIRADQDMNTCVWFVFEPSGQGFDPGRYDAELYVNGSRYDSIQFSVR